MNIMFSAHISTAYGVDTKHLLCCFEAAYFPFNMYTFLTIMHFNEYILSVNCDAKLFCPDFKKEDYYFVSY